MYGYVLDGYWQDIGNLDQYRQANFDALDERVKLNISGIRLRGNDLARRGRCSSTSSSRSRARPSSGTTAASPPARVVGPYAVLGTGVTLREHAVVSRSVVDAETYLGRSTLVEGAILGRSCDVRSHARVHEGAAIGDDCTLGAGERRHARRADLPLQGSRVGDAGRPEPDLGVARRLAARRRRDDVRPRQRRPDARDGPPARDGARHRAQARFARRRRAGPRSPRAG